MDALEVVSSSMHVLPPLPYGAAALEPYVDARTMTLHHGKHHASYVTKLNEALASYPELRCRTPQWLLLNLGTLPKEIRVAVRDNAGGHVNHGLLWQAMYPAGEGAGEPSGALADAIARDFGSLALFKAQFADAGTRLFGSGWVWLVRHRDAGGGLDVVTTTGHDNPSMRGRFPLLLNDVWEHAYYLKHENRRAQYLDGWWRVVNWREAERRYESSALPTEQAMEVHWTRTAL